jgi:hypothetical protein
MKRRKIMVIETTLRVIVHYIAAPKPFKDEHADRNETVGHLKSRVLVAFGLTEGSTADGATVNYTLYHNKEVLENPQQKLGDLINEHQELELKLAQQIVQG